MTQQGQRRSLPLVRGANPKSATLVNARRERYDVLIARPSQWGNPFVIGQHGTREQVIARYREWIKTQPSLLGQIPSLRGKRLGCYCGADQRCHGEVLLDLIEDYTRAEIEVVVADRLGVELPAGPTGYDPRKHGADCDSCPLNKRKPVPPEAAVADLKFVVVGEAPGRYEEKTGQPFIGPSGKLLNAVLQRNGLDRRNAHVTNSILCRSETDIDTAAAQVCCSKRFFGELEKLDAKAPIFALGAWAAKMVLGVRGIIKSRGFVWEAPRLDAAELKKAVKAAADSKSAYTKLKPLRQAIGGRTVLPMLHPAFILRTETWAALLDVDMARAARLLEAGSVKRFKLEDKARYKVVATAANLKREAASLDREVTVDIETDGPDPLKARIICVGIGDTKKTIIANPWRRSMVRVLSEIFRNRIIVGHNIILFDAIVLRRDGVVIARDQIEDTMVAHHAFASHLPKSLLHVGSVFVDASPWKQQARGEGKNEKGLPQHLEKHDLELYNAGDVRVTALSRVRMLPAIEPEARVYENDKRMGDLCARMRIKGFAFDIDRARELGKTLQGRKNALLGEMRKLTKNGSFSPSKPNDIRKALFGRFHSTLIRPTATGLPSTSRAVLEALRSNETKAGQLSDLVLRWREAEKTKGTYLSVPVGDDGRVHDNWRMATVTGRLAAKLVTLPKYTPDAKGYVDPTDRVRECYIAPPGWRLVAWDLSQCEMRASAHFSGDPNFIEACKGDVHAGNARVLFPDAVADGSLKDDKTAKTLGKKWRDIAKNAGFAVTYLAEWETVYAYLTSHGFPVSVRDVRAMLSRLHVAYAVYFEYVARNVAFVQKHGYLRTPLMGRIRWFGRYPKPTEVAAFPISGGIADFMNERLLRVDERLDPRTAFIVAQVHDAAYIQCRENKVEAVENIVREEYNPPIKLADGREFTIPIDLKNGERWSEL